MEELIRMFVQLRKDMTLNDKSNIKIELSKRDVNRICLGLKYNLMIDNVLDEELEQRLEIKNMRR